MAYLIEMTCSVCKSKKQTKRKCLDKDKVVEPTPKRPNGRPRKDWAPPSSSQTSPLSDHLGATSEPTRTGRGGRVIKRGRGSRGGRGERKNEGSHVPQEFGVFIAEDGTCMTNVSCYLIFVLL